MSRNVIAGVILVSIVFLLGAVAFAEDPTKIRFLTAVYSDDKGGDLKSPEGVACQGGNRFIVADSGNGRLLRYTFEERILKGDEELKVPQLPYPMRLQVTSQGGILALDGKLRKIARLTAAGAFAGYLDPAGLPAPAAMLPRSFKIDSHDTVFILDVGSERVVVLDPSGTFVRQIPFPREYGFFSDLAVDEKGSVFLLDSLTASVLVAANGATAFAPFVSTLQEYLNFPTALSVDGKGKVYIMDQNGSGVVTVGSDGSFLGRQLAMGWKNGLLYYPSQFCLTTSSELIIADRGNSRVQIFELMR